MTQPLKEIPTPRYSIGTRVYHPVVEQFERDLPCPDCLGTKLWKAVSPGGQELSVACPRCTQSYSQDHLPRLKMIDWKVWTKVLTIGSVQIDTARTRGEGWGEPVQYMALETGVGSGSVYMESMLFSSDAEALAAGEVQAQLKRLELSEKEANKIRQVTHLSRLQFEEAWIAHTHGVVWNAHWGLRRLIEDLEEMLKENDEAGGGEPTTERIQEILERDLEYRDPSPLQKLLDLIRGPEPTVEAIRQATDAAFGASA